MNLEQEELKESQDHEEKKKEKPVDPLTNIFGQWSQKPSQEQMDQWKAQYGDVHYSVFDEEEIYIWRPINAFEYRNITKSTKNEESFQESIVRKCVIHPTFTVESLNSGKAGTIPTLFQQVMYCSNFLPPEDALAIVRKL